MSDNVESAQTANTAPDTSKVVGEVVKTLFESTKAATLSAIENSKDGIEIGQGLISDGVSKTVTLIKKYPIESAVAGFAAGCLVGLLLRRRD